MKRFIIIALITTVFVTTYGQKPKTGYTNIEHLQTFEWFREGFTSYTPDSFYIEQIKSKFPSDYSILLFGGTWCPDTQFLLPHYVKVIQEAKIPEDNVKIYLLNHRLKSKGKLEKGYEIWAIPTFIMFNMHDQEEVIRIVEYPAETIEIELAKILNETSSR